MKILEGKVAVITGASGGIGCAVVKKFLAHGAKVAAIYHSKEGGLKDIEDKNLYLYSADVCDCESLKILAEKIQQDLGNVQILVNNAGISKSALFFAMGDKDWDEVIQTDLYGPRNVTKEFLYPMIRKKGGSIINISSVNGLVGNPGQSNYCAAKAGLIGMTKALAREVAVKKIRVNAVAPGYIETEMLKETSERLLETFKNDIPMKRFGMPEEVADLVLFLASEHSSYITGQVFVIDGGLSS